MVVYKTDTFIMYGIQYVYMVDKTKDTQIVISKELKARIKINAAKAGMFMRTYLDRLVPKE